MSRATTLIDNILIQLARPATARLTDRMGFEDYTPSELEDLLVRLDSEDTNVAQNAKDEVVALLSTKKARNDISPGCQPGSV